MQFLSQGKQIFQEAMQVMCHYFHKVKEIQLLCVTLNSPEAGEDTRPHAANPGCI